MEPYIPPPPEVKGILLLEFDGDRVFLKAIADSDEQEAALIRAFVARFGGELETMQ